MAWGMVSQSFHQLAGIPGVFLLAGKPLLERRQVNLGWYLPVAQCQVMVQLYLKQSLKQSAFVSVQCHLPGDAACCLSCIPGCSGSNGVSPC